jgi:hypothetical protein
LYTVRLQFLTIIACLIALGLVSSAHALTVCSPVTVNAPSAGVSQSAVESETCTQVQSKFQTGNLSTVMGEMAKAHALSAQGTVADYWSNMQIFSLGASTTVAFRGTSSFPLSSSDFSALSATFSSGTIPNAGLGLTASGTFGVSLRHLNLKRRGFFDPKNLNLYVGFMVLPTISSGIYSVTAASGSAYAQYKILPGRAAKLGLATWGGVDVGLGYTYSSSTLGLSSTSAITSVSFTTNGQNVVYEPAGSLSLAYASHVIPIEVSTNASVLYFLSFAFGLAMDVHLLSSAAITGTISGPVKVNGTSTSADYANFNLTETAKQTSVAFRMFMGPQFNIWKVRIFTLAHISHDATYGVTFGARFAW